MEEIIPGLWIGDLACALATDYLSLAGITHVVTAMKQSLPSPILLPDGRRIEKEQMYHVRLDDLDDAPILVHLPGAVDFIDSALKQDWLEDDNEAEEEGQKEQVGEGSSKTIMSDDDPIPPPKGKRKGQWATTGEGTVLVHCQAGVSRSVAIVAAYLMRTRLMSLSDAIALIQSRRCQADPNPGFRHQLELFESASCNVDVRNQRVRRFLMSQASILNGDSIDDVMLSYYPSPLHSPSSSSVSNFLGPSGPLHFSSLDSSEEGTAAATTRTGRSRTSSFTNDGNNTSRSSSTTVRQGKGATSAATSQAPLRLRKNSRSDAMSKLDLSKSPPLPDNVSELFDAADREQASEEDTTSKLIKERFTSIKEEHEVLVTISKGNLPGGVARVKGNQGRGNGDERLPKPTFRGPKLRCKICRWELAAIDHVIEHEAGRGKDAFDVRKREKDVDAKSKEARTVRELGIEERFGAQTRIRASHRKDEVEDKEKEDRELQQQQQQQQSPSQPPPTPPPESPAISRSGIQSAANLSAQLPPHLAALRQGRAGQQAVATPSNEAPPSRKLLHSTQCSSYFVEPLAWMAALKAGEITGRLNCPNARCGAKLGSWDWAGMQCACGAWVTPAFALHKSKVDEI
ncbi:hypothetical protein CBS101457_000562 [Exobasidium rhododendri]|nr:hypothetical protein CBS101457_000562 [Exobasidium rhododendri]